MCETLMSDVVAPEAHQNDWLGSADLLSIHYARISMVGGYTEDLKKPQNCQNWGVGACAGWACPGQYSIFFHLPKILVTQTLYSPMINDFLLYNSLVPRPLPDFILQP